MRGSVSGAGGGGGGSGGAAATGAGGGSAGSAGSGAGATGPGSGATRGSLTVDLQNQTPPGQSQFIAGPYPGLGTSYGEYIGLLAVNLPPRASDLEVRGGAPKDAFGAEGPVWLLATPVDVKDGATQQIVITFQWPAGPGSMTIVPSARLNPVSWHYRGAVYNDASPFTLSW